MKKIALLFMVFVMAACVSETRKEATSRLDQAKNLIQGSEMEKGIRLLDSIPVWYPGEYKIVGDAMKLKKEAAQAYHEAFIQQAQEMLDELEPRIKEFSKNFVFTPGPPGRPGMWEHKRQTVRNSWSRIFLKVNITEDGQFWITSHYYGQEWLDHNSIKVYDRDIYEFSDTIPLSHPDNHKIEDGTDKWEKIDFKNGSDGGVVAFIIQNADRRLKVRFTGKRHYYIVMEAFDKDAVVEGYELAQVLQDVDELKQKIENRKRELRILGVSVDSLNQ